MNTKRLLLAWLLTLVAVIAFELALFHGAGLDDFHRQHRDMLRTPANELRMTLVVAFNYALLTVFYAWIVRGRTSTLLTGLIFGLFMGLLAGWIPQSWMPMMIANWPFYPWWAVAHFGELVVAGLVLGAIYRE